MVWGDFGWFEVGSDALGWVWDDFRRFGMGLGALGWDSGGFGVIFGGFW